jgi:hypothetical protein
VLPTSLSGALAAALREYGSAAHDEHYRHSCETRPMLGLRVPGAMPAAARLTLRN